MKKILFLIVLLSLVLVMPVFAQMGTGAFGDQANAGGGTGDMVGPGSVTADGNVLRSDGTGGKIMQDSGCNISDAEIMTCAGFVSTGTGDFVITTTGGTLINASYANDRVRMGDTTDNYIQMTQAGVMTFVGTGDVVLPDNSVDSNNVNFNAMKYGMILLEDHLVEGTNWSIPPPLPHNATLENIDCITDPYDTAKDYVWIDLFECDSNGLNCVNVDASIYCDNDGASDDGSISNPNIDADAWFLLSIGTVNANSGTVDFLSIGWDGPYE